MRKKELILEEIQRIAKQSETPPGRQVFERETGIRMSEWYGVYWRSWGDALKEAGFTPNKIQGRFASDDVLRKYAEAVRHFGRVPAEIDIRMYARGMDDFPGHTTFRNHFGNKAGLIAAFSEWLSRNDDFADLVELLPETSKEEVNPVAINEGLVYLLKSGDHYKIGRSDEIERRLRQISIALPEEVTLVHTIRTDDPSGIEAYWHRRFSEKRANGEWFRLNISEVRAFKRRNYQ